MPNKRYADFALNHSTIWDSTGICGFMYERNPTNFKGLFPSKLLFFFALSLHLMAFIYARRGGFIFLLHQTLNGNKLWVGMEVVTGQKRWINLSSHLYLLLYSVIWICIERWKCIYLIFIVEVRINRWNDFKQTKKFMKYHKTPGICLQCC